LLIVKETLGMLFTRFLWHFWGFIYFFEKKTLVEKHTKTLVLFFAKFNVLVNLGVPKPKPYKKPGMINFTPGFVLVGHHLFQRPDVGFGRCF
jgi:hypothetical protein